MALIRLSQKDCGWRLTAGECFSLPQVRAGSASHSLTAAEFRSRKRSSRALISNLRAALGVRPFGVPRSRGPGWESRVYAVGRRRVKVRERGRWEAAVRFAHARPAG